MLRQPIITDEDDDSDDFETVIGHDGEPVRVLRDQRKLRVSLHDAQRLRGEPWLHDGRGTGFPVGHRPGFIVDANPAAQDAKARAYQDYEHDLVNAWKRGDAAPAGAYPFRQDLIGTSCTVDGRAGRLVEQDGWLVCVPNKQPRSFIGSDPEPASDSDVRDHASRMRDLYNAYDRDLAQQWRNGK
jgi:hypothetical protein